MQSKLPLFPSDVKQINDHLAFREQDGFVYYLYIDSPIYCHAKNDKNSYRHTLASLVVNQVCTVGELSKALGINRKNIERYRASYLQHGPGWFFDRPDGRGQCYKMTEDLLPVIQEKLDSGKSMYRIAKEHGISQSAITYHIKKGTLKKK